MPRQHIFNSENRCINCGLPSDYRADFGAIPYCPGGLQREQIEAEVFESLPFIKELKTDVGGGMTPYELQLLIAVANTLLNHLKYKKKQRRELDVALKLLRNNLSKGVAKNAETER
jgi:hypothetical protein